MSRRGVRNAGEVQMNGYVVTILLVSCLVGWVVRCEATEQLPPRGPQLARPAVAVAPATREAPTIDGVLDDACWASAVTVGPFNLSYQGRFAPYRAEALLAYDADALYVALRVDDPDPKEAPWLPWPPDRDSNVAEVLLDAGAEEQYYKLAVNSEGEVYVTQPMGKTVAWQAPVQAAIHRGRDQWTAEFAVPFAAAGQPAPGADDGTLLPWRMNFGWRTKKCTNYSAWAVTHAWFYEPQYYGDVYFGGSEALTAQLRDVQRPGPGTNLLPLDLVNRAEADARCEVLLTLEDEAGRRVAFHRLVAVPGNGGAHVPVAYTLEDGMRGVATVTVRREGEAGHFFQQSYPMEVPFNRRGVRAARAALTGIPETTAGPVGAIRAELVKHVAVLGQQLDEAATARDWAALAAPVREAAGQAQKLEWWHNHWQVLGDRSFAVQGEHTLRKLLKDAACLAEPVDVIALGAARGEYEGAQLAVVPLGEDLTNIRVTAGDLTGPAGAVISADAIEVRWVGFVDSRTPRYPVDYIGGHPDPLFPMDAVERSVPADALHQPLWVTVAVPRGIPAGVYNGGIEVEADGAEPWPVGLRLRVYDFDLPVKPALQTSMWLNPGRIKEWYGWDEIPEDVLRKEMAFLLEHRVNPSWFGPMGTDDDIEFQLERGLNLVMLGVAAEWPIEPEIKEKIDRYYAFFKERDLLDMVFIYGRDEPSAEHYPEVRDTLTRVAQEYPGVRRVCTAYPPVPELEGAVDTWVVGPNLFNYEPVAKRLAAGDELWFYLSASVRRPYGSQFYLDYTAMEHRLVSWFSWKYGATGFLYWGINEWHSNILPWSGDPAIDDAIAAGKRWPEVPWNTWTYLNCNGDAQYIYPGPNGEFWSSVRLEIIRDAFEDYDYFSLLDEARRRLAEADVPGKEALVADAEALLTLGPPLIADLTEATAKPMELLNRREEIAEHIERIQGVLATLSNQ